MNKHIMGKRILSAVLIIILLAAIVPVAYFYRDEGRYGFAKRLDGRTAVVAVFASDSSCSWDEDDREIMKDRLSILDTACAFLEVSAAYYGKKATLIRSGEDSLSSITEDPGNSAGPLLYADISADLSGSEPDTAAVDEWILSEDVSAHREKLMKTAFCTGIIYVFFLNTPKDNSNSSQSYMWMSQGDPETEFVLMHSYVNHKKEGPNALAHELLHSFGAHDLYKSSTLGYEEAITDEYVQHLKSEKSDDVMFSVYDPDTGQMPDNEVDKVLSPVTAYYTGLIDHCEDVDRFDLGPSIYEINDN